MIPLVLATALAGEPILPSYRDTVAEAAWVELDEALTTACRWPEGSRGIGAPLACSEPRVRAVLERLGAFVGAVTDDAALRHLEGLAHRHLGDVDAARASLQRAVALDPDLASAWYDLGEVYLNAQDWRAAADAFERAAALRPRSAGVWLQVAQAAGWLHDADTMERALRQALRHGFSFRLVTGNPAWQGFYADEALHPMLDRLLDVYADDSVEESLQTAPAP